MYHAGNPANKAPTGDAYWFMLGQLYKDSEADVQEEQIDDQGRKICTILKSQFEVKCG
jgi:hypothetical protein